VSLPKREERPPGSGRDSNTKSSSTEKRAVSKMKRSKTDLDNSEWELHQNPEKRGTYLKKPKILASRIELGLIAKQWQAVRSKVELSDVSSAADIAAETSRQLDLAENVRSKSKNIKGDLNNHINIGIIISKHAIYKLAKRASDVGDLGDLAAKDRVMSLMRDRDDLQKEVDDLKRKLTSKDATPSNLEAIREEDWATGIEDAPSRSVTRVTRSRASTIRRRLVSSSDSESRVSPVRSKMDPRESRDVPERTVSAARKFPVLRSLAHIGPREEEFPPLPPLSQRRPGRDMEASDGGTTGGDRYRLDRRGAPGVGSAPLVGCGLDGRRPLPGGRGGGKFLFPLPLPPRRPVAGASQMKGGGRSGDVDSASGFVGGRRGVVRIVAVAPTDYSVSSASEWRPAPSSGRRSRKRRSRRRGGDPGGRVDAGPGPVSVPSPARPERGSAGAGGRLGHATGQGDVPRAVAPRAVPRRSPRTAAVALTCEENGPSYAEMLRKARERISLADLNIDRTRIRRAATGSCLSRSLAMRRKKKQMNLRPG